MKNRVRIEINGSKYTIHTDEEEKYVYTLAAEVNQDIKDLMSRAEGVSLDEALIIAALSYLDSYHKSEQSADHVRTQLTEYLEEAATARIELDEAKREIERLRRFLEPKRD